MAIAPWPARCADSPGCGVDLGDHHLGAFAGEQDSGGAADPGPRAGNESDLSG